MRRLLPALLLFTFPSLLNAAAVPVKQTASPRLFTPPKRPALPAIEEAGWANNPIDRFILARLEAKRLAPTAPADRLKLLRRLNYDLTGLPPTVEEQEAFLADRAPDAYTRLVDRLLGSTKFGERWATYWLDLVRFAETDGFKEDAHRPEAYRYRDWVIRALNENVPYDRFLGWQLAGDELAPGNRDALIATGFNRHFPDESNAINLEQRRQEILDDITDTAGFVFMGMTVGCAKCHDHKYDPIPQRDYFRLQSFFAAMQPTDVPLASATAMAEHRQKRAAWEKSTKEVREEIDRLLAPKAKSLRDSALERFHADLRVSYLTPPEKRTPLQWQIAQMIQRQVDKAGEGAVTRLDAAGKKKHQELQKKLAAFGPAPAPLPTAMAIVDVGRSAPATHRLMGGDWRKPAGKVEPAFPAFLSDASPDMRLSNGVSSTGRRAALARWLTEKDHPLTARVMVNRLWQHHFGVGIVPTASDFGAQGLPPTHPELLDWLAVELVESGWDLKHLHRLMVTSATYQQDSAIDPKNHLHARGQAVDRDNDLLWRSRRRRLEGEAIRDAMLRLSGEMSPVMFGVSAKPDLPANLSRYAWKADTDPLARDRRSVYVLAKRNLRYPLFDAFDLPDMHNSCSRRVRTTTSPQALLLLNGESANAQAETWSKRLSAKSSEVRSLVESAYRAAWCRVPQSDEVAMGERFVSRQADAHRGLGLSPAEARSAALADFCHAVMNANEFVYVD